MLAALENVPRDHVEAADVDGAGSWQIFREIIWPQIVPVAATVMLIRAIEAFKIVDLPNIMTGGGPGIATESMSMHSFFAWRANDYGQSAAVAYLLLVRHRRRLRLILQLRRAQADTEGGMSGSDLQIREGKPNADAAAVRAAARSASCRRRRASWLMPFCIFWSAFVLFPIYWVVITAFKLPEHVNSGPRYLPFVDYQPSLHAWQSLFTQEANCNLASIVRQFGLLAWNSITVVLSPIVSIAPMETADLQGLPSYVNSFVIGVVATIIIIVVGAWPPTPSPASHTGRSSATSSSSSC